MSRDQLEQRITGHNRFLVAVGILLIPTSIVLWFLSYYLIKFAMVYLLGLFGWEPYAEHVTWGIILLLAFEGVRYARQQIDLQAYTDTAYYDNFVVTSFVDSTSGYMVMHRYGNPFAVAFVGSRFLFLAPLATVEVVSSFQSRLPSDDQTIDDAADMLRELRATRKWTPAEHFKKFGGALFLLSKMKLIWTDTREGEVHVRIPPGE